MLASHIIIFGISVTLSEESSNNGLTNSENSKTPDSQSFR